MGIDINKVAENVEKIAYTLDRSYLQKLTETTIVPFDDVNISGKNEKVNYNSNIRAVKVLRWTYDKELKVSDCFKNVLSSFADGDHSIAVAIHRLCDSVEMFFVVKNEGPSRDEESEGNLGLLKDSLLGNFQGSELKCDNLTMGKTDYVLGHIEDELFKNMKSVAVLVNNPSEYSEDNVSQGFDRLLNGIIPAENDDYWVVFLAESLGDPEIREVMNGYEEMATTITPFSGYQFQVGSNQSESFGEMQSLTNTDSVSKSISRTHSVGASLGANAKIKGIGASASVNYGYSKTKSEGEMHGTADTKGTTYAVSIGTSESSTYSYKSYSVSNLTERLEKAMKRINSGKASGLWKFATYVFSDESQKSLNIANYVRGLMQGNDSYVESSAIQEWFIEEKKEEDSFKEIRKYIAHFMHPIFCSRDEESVFLLSPTSYVSTSELSKLLAFPQKSMQGLPVVQSVSFGREPHAIDSLDLDLEIGIGYHMRSEVKNQAVKISKEELTKHTFITGSTGAGKSYTVYKLLEQLGKNKVKFLVIEPAKGEYRKAIGSKKNVFSYGTNPNLEGVELLRINPFEFPSNTHILEHLDRIIDVFNVCWPMYAAMPAILKDAIEKAYEGCGWDLQTSLNKYGEKIYPSFSDVVVKIRDVLDKSEYSADNKGDYTGALVTRIKSLCNGINGLIFTSKALSDQELFDQNVIVDLSRIGSSETKAFIMGLLVIKLQEYRMENPEPNSKLAHVTVLEEAHNLLKRSTVSASGEGSNMQAKSVEMLANSIAEMRTYGEGFVIADQSPGLLDMSVIRNTNTKIIMRLPDITDRELVGKAAGLNEAQIEEIGRLATGVAAISQSGWLEAILCKIGPYPSENEDVFMNSDKGQLLSTDVNEQLFSEKEVEQSLLDYLMNTKELYRKTDSEDLIVLKKKVMASKIDSFVKVEFLDLLNKEGTKGTSELRKLLFDFLHAEEALFPIKSYDDVFEWSERVLEDLKPSITEYSEQQKYIALSLIVYEKATKDSDFIETLSRLREVNLKGGVR